MSTVRNILKTLNKTYPLARAEAWDSVGLLVGAPDASVSRVLVAHEITREVLQAASDYQAIVTYHPLIFKPLKTLDFSDSTARLVGECISGGVAVVAAHTALDNAPLPYALGDGLALQLDLENIGVLGASGRETVYQIAVHVPQNAVEVVSRALWDAGAGRFGHYADASFQTAGVGTFTPLDGAHPTIGQVGENSRVDEARLEVIVPEAARDEAVRAMLAAHPYEEVSYVVHTLHNTIHPYGAARVGKLSEEVPFEAFAMGVRDKLGAPNLRVVQSGPTVKKVACVPGSGASFINAAHRAGCDVLVTGDIKHHDALKARALGLSLVDATHVATERAAVGMLFDALEDLPTIEVVRYEGDTNPFTEL